MLEHPRHEELLAGATARFQDLFASSEQAMYLYLDDQHRSCNHRFAEWLGYRTVAEWGAVPGPFPMAFVHPLSHSLLIDTFRAALATGVASQIPVTWKRKDGRPLKTNVILVPIDHEGHRFALHFISKV